MSYWLRHNVISRWLLTVCRVILGYYWLIDGYDKVFKGFDAKGFIMGAIAKPVLSPEGKVQYGAYGNFLKHFVLPNVNTFNFLVSWGELLVGLGLVVGAFTTAAVFFGLLMNFSYLLAGTVSINPIYIIVEFIILFAGYNAGRIGLDHWIIPWIRKHSFLPNETR
ncbi:DoxX family membrane protein [Paucilactobacillus kaifaensis]|uniref:DoxX family membrane protein n=1 Tax=Paucilactobacillus kaifaensis TaxID=2559921 RepID=UPI0010F51910|nr:DoxX family membrane protein [Paucilactobacillus kaifaensis]